MPAQVALGAMFFCRDGNRMNYFAIMEKETGFFLPMGRGCQGKGFTAVDFVSPLIQPPRMFIRAQDAKTALSWWLKGRVSCQVGSDGNPSWYVQPVAGRRKALVQVVQLKIDILDDDQ
jgi:hypothetical protein